MDTKAEKIDWMREHLSYEWCMLIHTMGRLRNTTEQLDWNAFFDAFTVHARNLSNFLSNASDSRFYKARDFVPAFHVEKSDEAFRAFQTFHAYEMYLAKRHTATTYDQFDVSVCADVLSWIRTWLNAFVESLDTEFRSAWDQPLFLDAIPELPTVMPAAKTPQAAGQITSGSAGHHQGRDG